MKNQFTESSLNQALHRKTLIVDELSILLAFVSAVLIRFEAITKWVDFRLEIYASLFLTVVLFQILIYTAYDIRRPTIVAMDPYDNLVKVIKSRLLLIGISITYFYASQRIVLTSKMVVGLFLILSMVYGYAFRMLYRFYYKRNNPIPGGVNAYILKPPFSLTKKAVEEILREDYDCAIVVPDPDDVDSARDAVKELEKQGVRAYLSLESMGYRVRSGIVTEIGDYAVIPAYVRSDRFKVFGVNFCIAKVEEAVHHVMEHLGSLKGKYICFSNVHTVVTAKEDPAYAEVLNGSAMTFADGTPIAQLERRKGLMDVERVAGPDFMESMFENTKDGRISHYFYGSKQETLDALKENLLSKYPDLNIKGMYSPPFRQLTPQEDEEDIKRINDTGADIIWIGLGAPKQEKWMNAHKDKLCGVMMGVGAGFDFHAGATKRAPVWIRKIGLEWLYRLFTDPGRLFKRYFVTNVKFFWYLFTGWFKKEV